MINEIDGALMLAEAVLNRPSSSDPDDDIAVLARQLIRQHELANKYKWQVRDTCTRAERAEAAIVEIIREWGNRGETTSLDVWHRRMKAAIATAKAIPNVKAAIAHHHG